MNDFVNKNGLAFTATVLVLANIAVPSQGGEEPIYVLKPGQVLEDFEGAKNIQWTYTGRAFETGPFDVAAYNRTAPAKSKITNYDGRKILISYAGDLNNTGTAESSVFQIKSDGIGFVIGGSKDAKTWVGLMVVDEDGTEKIVRTSTPDGSLNLVEKQWATDDLHGKRAKIVISDQSKSGYLIVGGFKGKSLFSNESLLSTGTASEKKFLTYFLENLVDKRLIDRSKKAYGLTDRQLTRLCNELTRYMFRPELDHKGGTQITPAQQAQKILEVYKEFVKAECPNANDALKDLLLMRALYDWTRTHFKYNRKLSQEIVARTADNAVTKKYWTPQYLLQMEKPNAVCAGINNTVQEMGASLGLDCFCVNGALRVSLDNSELAESPREATSHKWVMFRHKDGYIDCFDASSGVIGLDVARRRTEGLHEPVASPITPSDWALHLATYRANVYSSDYRPIPSENSLLSISYEQWRNMDVTPLKNLPFNPKWYETGVVTWDYR